MLVKVTNNHRGVVGFVILLLTYIADLLRNKPAALSWFLHAILTYDLAYIFCLQMPPHPIRSYCEETVPGLELLNFDFRFT